MRFYCTSTGPIGGLNCEVLLYLNWSLGWSQMSHFAAYFSEFLVYSSIPMHTMIPFGLSHH